MFCGVFSCPTRANSSQSKRLLPMSHPPMCALLPERNHEPPKLCVSGFFGVIFCVQKKRKRCSTRWLKKMFFHGKCNETSSPGRRGCWRWGRRVVRVPGVTGVKPRCCCEGPRTCWRSRSREARTVTFLVMVVVCCVSEPRGCSPTHHAHDGMSQSRVNVGHERGVDVTHVFVTWILSSSVIAVSVFSTSIKSFRVVIGVSCDCSFWAPNDVGAHRVE